MSKTASKPIGEFQCQKCGNAIPYRPGEVLRRLIRRNWPTCCDEDMVVVPDPPATADFGSRGYFFRTGSH
jgi:hypothetical protein